MIKKNHPSQTKTDDPECDWEDAWDYLYYDAHEARVIKRYRLVEDKVALGGRTNANQ